MKKLIVALSILASMSSFAYSAQVQSSQDFAEKACLDFDSSRSIIVKSSMSVQYQGSQFEYIEVNHNLINAFNQMSEKCLRTQDVLNPRDVLTMVNYLNTMTNNIVDYKTQQKLNSAAKAGLDYYNKN